MPLNGGKTFQTSQLKQCTEHFCVLYSTAFSSKITGAHKVQTVHLCSIILVSLCCLQSWLPPPKLHHPGSHPVSSNTWGYLQKLLRQLLSEVYSVTTMQDRSMLAKWLLSTSTQVTQHLPPPQLFKEVFRQRIKCSEAFLKEYLQAYSYASTGAYSWVNPTRY